MLEIKDLTLIYKSTGKVALNKINLTVDDGIIYGFLGANGAGKSTTIKCIVSILQANSGEILFDGEDINKNPMKFKSQLGYVPDLNNAYEHISGKHYLKRIAIIEGLTDKEEIEKIIDDYVTRFNLNDVINQPIKTYSFGTKQKINFIAGIIHNPKLLILDEPMTGLDPDSSLTMIEIMKEYAQKGNSVFFSSHMLNMVEKVCDKVGFLENGNLKKEFYLKENRDEIKNLFKINEN